MIHGGEGQLVDELPDDAADRLPVSDPNRAACDHDDQGDAELDLSGEFAAGEIGGE